MTLTEARKKWCPFVRVWDNEMNTEESAAAVNRQTTGEEYEDSIFACLASQCMMWTGKDSGLKHPHLEEK
jgi:hypothetical protein